MSSASLLEILSEEREGIHQIGLKTNYLVVSDK